MQDEGRYEVKTCPCCKSMAFDDLDICYVCLHPFKKDVDPAARDLEQGMAPCETASDRGGTGLGGGRAISDTSGAIKSISSLGEVSDDTLDDAVEDAPGQADSHLAARREHRVDDGPVGIASQDGARFRISVDMEGFPPFSMDVVPGDARITIGRALDNKVIIPDLHVSRKHAEVFLDGGRLWVRDCGSKNMTFLDGLPVIGTREAHDGSRIGIGSAWISVGAEEDDSI